MTRVHRERQGSPVIPEFLWFAVRVAALAGCVAWYKRVPSPHLATAVAGLSILTLLILPGLFQDLFGWEAFDELASSFIDPEPSSSMAEGREPGQLLLDRCALFEWIGMAFLALGITRFSKQLAAPSPPVP